MMEAGFSKGRFFSKRRALMPSDLLDRRRLKEYRAGQMERYFIDVDLYHQTGLLVRVNAS